MATLRADRRLYLTADRSEVVEEGDERAAWLLAGEGGLIRESDVARHGLSMKGGKVRLGKKSMPAPENKMASPPEDKAAGAEPKEDDEPEDEAEDAEEWDLSMSPEAYLNRYPDGPNADLARRLSSDDAAD